MKIALCSTMVPFVSGGYRNIVEWLQAMLEQDGHQVDRIYLPQIDAPDLLFQQIAAYRWIDLRSADRIICFRPEAHLIPHPHKIVWFIHHMRQFYDLWDTAYRGFPDDLKHRGIRAALHSVDTAALREARKVFANSQVVSNRIRLFNNVESQVLYPPVFQPERFHCNRFSDEIVCICRLEHHKRQHLLIEAVHHTRTPVRLRLCGPSLGEGYARDLQLLIASYALQERVVLESRWISEQEKITYFADCLASAYIPVDEDSYGYPTIESSHSCKAILTTSDSGGVLELVLNGVNGFVTEPTAVALAEAMDKLYVDKVETEAMGKNASIRLCELDISWPHVMRSLLS